MFHPVTQIFKVVSGPSFKEMALEIPQMREKVDGFELRLDRLPTLSKRDLLPWIKSPLILTWKGGSERALLKLLELGPTYVDLPRDAPLALFKKISTEFSSIQIISSYHNFEKTPPSLPLLLDSLKNPFATHYKIACTAHSTCDALRMLHLVKKTGCIGLCMGPYGSLTRILAPVVAAPLIYVGAPGQIDLDDLLTTYRFRSLNRQTNIYGLIGNPVEQSPSHHIHNDLLSQLNVNAVYLKMLLEKEELPEFFSLIEDLPFQGLSVTAPFKEEVIPFLSSLSIEAQEIGAVNTLTRTPAAPAEKFSLEKCSEVRAFLSSDAANPSHGVGEAGGQKRAPSESFLQGKFSAGAAARTPSGWHGTNTDGRGGLDALGDVSGKHLVILGAGGAAKAIAYEALKRGARLTLCNRTQTKGEELAQRLEATFSKTLPPSYDILINTTPHIPETLLPCSTLMDLSPQPAESPFLLNAHTRGCKTIRGFYMFIYQAIGQFVQWLPEKEALIKRFFHAFFV